MSIKTNFILGLLFIIFAVSLIADDHKNTGNS